jgi:D-glycero-alpha-D-manno-heptose-7-phosphate kinase
MEIIRCRSPLRISFAGGGTDVPSWAKKYGGQVISTTIDKYIFVTINPIESRIIKVIAHDLNKISEFNIETLDYNGDSDIIKAVIKYFKINRGYCISIHSDLPAGSGMGTSSALAVALIKGFSLVQNQNLKPNDIANIACYIERDELKEAGGYQDQYASAMGGFNFMTFSNSVNIYPLKLSKEFSAELNYRMILCYTGKTHISKEIHNIMINNHGKIEFEEGMIALKQYAADIRDIFISQMK